MNLKGSAPSYGLEYLKEIKNTIKKVKPDIVLVCDDGLKGMLLPRLIGKNFPMIYERHVSRNISVKSDNPSFAKRFQTRLLFALMHWGGSKYDAFVVLTNGNLKEWKLNNLRVIPNPLSFYPKNSQVKQDKIVIAVGKHSFQKGYDLLMEAWKEVSPKHPDWTLEIYGTLHSNFSIKPIITQYNLESSVKLYDPIRDIASKFQKSSIHVLSSRFEGFGMVITEAMACGLPSISFDCPHGPSDIITDQYNGLLVENGNTDAMAKAICKLIEDEKFRVKLKKNAKASVQSYKIEEIARQWDSLFEELNH